MRKLILLLVLLGLQAMASDFSFVEESPVSTIVFHDGISTDVSDALAFDSTIMQSTVTQEKEPSGYYDFDGNFVTQDPISQESNLQLIVDHADNEKDDKVQVLDIEPSTESYMPDASKEGDRISIDLNDFKTPQSESLEEQRFSFGQDEQQAQPDSDDHSYLSASFEMPIKSEKQIYDNLGNQVDSVDGLNTYLALDSGEEDVKIADQKIQEKQQDCIVIYSQCSYQGESMQICESLKQIEDFKNPIMSIYIPAGYSMSLYDHENFSGQRTVYKSSQECLGKPVSFLQLRGTQSQNLRRNEILRK